MLIPITLDMRSTQKVMAGFIAKRNVEGMLVAFIDLTKTSGMLFERLKDGPERVERRDARNTM
jgi:hypothetical protein